MVGMNDSCHVSGVQVNFAGVDKILTTAVEDKDDIHTNTNDEPTRLWVIYLFISKHADDAFPGQVVIANTRIYCTRDPFGILVLSARNSHCRKEVASIPLISQQIRLSDPDSLRASNTPSYPTAFQIRPSGSLPTPAWIV